MRQRRALAWGGIVGPAGFVVAWAAAGALATGYAPATDAISQLAAVHAPTRWLMTAGFGCFGVAVICYSVALRDALEGRAWLAAAVTGVATLGAGAFALGASPAADLVHGGFATVGSASFALLPILAARPLSVRGHRRAAVASRLVGVVCGACLVAALFVPAHGLLQRIGLSAADVWLAASAVAIIRGRMRLPWIVLDPG